MLIETDFGRCEYSFEDDYVHIYNLYVSPEFRKQGHARELLRMAIDSIRLTGYTGEIQIVANSEEAIIDIEKLKLFYRSMGL